MRLQDDYGHYSYNGFWAIINLVINCNTNNSSSKIDCNDEELYKVLSSNLENTIFEPNFYGNNNLHLINQNDNNYLISMSLGIMFPLDCVIRNSKNDVISIQEIKWDKDTILSILNDNLYNSNYNYINIKDISLDYSEIEECFYGFLGNFWL